MVSIDDYSEVRECDYKGEHYSVRDNGAIMRHKRDGKPKRPLDEKWTLGTLNAANGYLLIGTERVHRIVATAFHGAAPTPDHVVDHFDTNHQNNRPENLRWLTKLENALNNPFTRKKIELICGSVEAFLLNPQLLWGHESDEKNFYWMKSVTKEEAQNCLENWNNWVRSVKLDPNYNKSEHQVGDWIYDKHIPKSTMYSDAILSNNSINANSRDRNNVESIEEVDVAEIKRKEKAPFYSGFIDENEADITDEDYKDSLTPSAKQLLLSIETLFPCCPSEVKKNGLEEYYNNLEIGALFSSNWKYKFYVVNKKLVPEKKTLVVLIERHEIGQDYRDYYLGYVFIRKGYYAHYSFRSHSDINIATRDFKITIGEEEPTEEEILNYDCFH